MRGNTAAKGMVFMKQSTKKMDVRQLTVTAMLTALAYAIAAASSLLMPIKIQGILSLEIKDCILTIGAFIFGPVTGLLMTVVVAFLEFITVSTTGWIGMVMNILSSAAFVCPAAMIYKSHRKVSGAVIGLAVGTVTVTVVMLLWNYIITPLYMQVAREMVVSMLIPVFLPFNLLKASLNGALTMLLYKTVVQVLRKAHLLPPSDHGPRDHKKTSAAVMSIAFVCAVTLLLTALAWSGIL